MESIYVFISTKKKESWDIGTKKLSLTASVRLRDQQRQLKWVLKQIKRRFLVWSYTALQTFQCSTLPVSFLIHICPIQPSWVETSECLIILVVTYVSTKYFLFETIITQSEKCPLQSVMIQGIYITLYHVEVDK